MLLPVKGKHARYTVYYIIIKFQNGNWAKIRYCADTVIGEEYVYEKYKQVVKVKLSLEETLEDLQK